MTTASPSDRGLDKGRLLSAASRNARSSAIRDLLVHARRPGVISLAGGLPAVEMFPSERLANLAASVLADPLVLQYGTTEGEVELREWIADQHGRLDGRVYTSNEVQIVSGSQQGLDLVARVLLDPGDVVAVADPEYLGAIGAFRQTRAELAPIGVDHHGLIVGDLERQLRDGLRPKCLYFIPEFHNPTGSTISLERLRSLAELSERYGFLIIEDNPYGRLRFDGTPIPTIATMTANVVQCRTISKTVGPGLRIAWIIGPDWLLDAVRIAKQSADLHTSTVGQRLALALMSDLDWYENHIDSLVPHYRERRDALAKSVSERLPESTFALPEGGMFLWVTLNGGLPTVDLLPRALDAGVAFVPGPAFAVSKTADHSMRLSFATATPAMLEEGISRLSGVILRSAT